MSSFEKFRNAANSAKIAENMMKSQNKNNYDDGSWKLDPDKETGAAEAVIRFLPPKDGDMPYELIYSHFFKGDDGKWCIIERCPRTFGEECACCAANGELYATGREEDKNKARARKARKSYVFNILVVKEPRHPENEGKVFPFKAGPAIFQMIMDAMRDDSEFGEAPKKPFDLFEGHNFVLRIRKEANREFPTYDKSFFQREATPVASSDAELERIFNSMINLKEFAESKRISESAIATKVAGAYCTTSPKYATQQTRHAFSEPEPEMPSYKAMDKLPWDEEPEAPVAPARVAPSVSGGSEMGSSSTDESMKFFEDLANGL